MRYILLPVFIGALLLLGPIQAMAVNPDELAKVDSATAVIQELMAIPDNGIPSDLLMSAQGIAVFPGYLRAGFIFGASYGQGILVTRLPDGTWTDPAFIKLGGGSFGLQIGAEATDLVLVLRTRSSVEQIENGRLILGATASVAAGPIGRTGEAATDVTLKTEVYSYSRTRGAFAGALLDGAVLSFDTHANLDFYGIPNPLRVKSAAVPDPARRFTCVLAKYTGADRQVCV